MNILSIARNKELCCGCNACETSCPKGAIQMTPDMTGQEYPTIDSNKCVDCSLCVEVCCKASETLKQLPRKTVAASSLNGQSSMKSSSGGIFSVLAEWILSNQGIVFGTVFTDDFDAAVIGIEHVDDLYRMQGSKYVRSRMGDVYREIEKQVKSGRQVLFCGVPCQVAAVRRYLRRDYENLLLADIVCHGTPSGQMFRDYLSYVEKRRNIRIVKFLFRDKTYGQNPEGSLEYSTQNTNQKERLRSYRSSYYQLFLNCSTFRERCYHCEFAARERVGDITLCDYWGIEDFHPGFTKQVEQAGLCGVSAVMMNTDAGLAAFEQIKNNLMFVESDAAKAAEKNPQLNAPSKKTAEHDEVMRLYAESGYEAVDRYYFKKYRGKILASTMGRKLPVSMQKQIISLKRKLKK